jgi:hypothetical protein
MTIGQGIAIAGVWMLPFAAIISKRVGNGGIWICILISFAVTGYLCIAN